MNRLNWFEFDHCINDITKKCKGKSLIGVYGFPRGGLCLAVALSHSLHIPLLHEPENNSLIVDDICQTGCTLEKIKGLEETEVYVWISKIKPKWWNAYKIIEDEDWFIFPWENIETAEDDKDLYYKLRK